MEFQASHNYGLTHITCIKIGKHQTMHTAHTHWKILIGVFSSELIKKKLVPSEILTQSQIVAFQSFGTFTQLLLPVDTGEQTLESQFTEWSSLLQEIQKNKF